MFKTRLFDFKWRLKQWWKNGLPVVSRKRHQAELQAVRERLHGYYEDKRRADTDVFQSIVAKAVKVRPELHFEQVPKLRVLTTIDAEMMAFQGPTQYREQYFEEMARQVARHVERELRTIDVVRAVAYARETRQLR